MSNIEDLILSYKALAYWQFIHCLIGLSMEICKNSILNLIKTILNLIKIPKFCGITGVKDNCVTGLPGLQKLCCHREKRSTEFV